MEDPSAVLYMDGRSSIKDGTKYTRATVVTLTESLGSSLRVRYLNPKSRTDRSGPGFYHIHSHYAFVAVHICGIINRKKRTSRRWEKDILKTEEILALLETIWLPL